MAYALWVGVVLNLERDDLRLAFAGARGGWLAADADSDLPHEYADAACLLEEEVDEVVFRANQDRQLRRARHKGMPF